MLKIAITGAAGRMGKTLIEACQQAENCSVTAAIERQGISLIGADAGELAGIGKLNVKLVDDIASVVNDFDVLIDFTSIESTLNNLQICKASTKKIIIGTKISVFLPFTNLGQIIIFDAHDWNHKQSDINPRFDARQVAKWLAKKMPCNLTLITPAPSLESFQKHFTN